MEVVQVEEDRLRGWIVVLLGWVEEWGVWCRWCHSCVLEGHLLVPVLGRAVLVVV